MPVVPRRPSSSPSYSIPAALEARGSLQAHAASFLQLPNTKPEQTLRAGAGNHLRKALWTGPGGNLALLFIHF